MKKLKKYVRKKPHLILTIPTVLCFISFITNFISAIKDGHIDQNELHELLSSADGFETVVLVLIMLFIRKRNK